MRRGREGGKSKKILSIILYISYFLFILTFSSTNLAAQEEDHTGPKKITVAVSLPDMVSIASSVGGNYTQCFNILPEGGDPHSFVPTADLIDRIKSSEIVVFAMSNELSYENQIKNSLKEDNYQGIILDFRTDYMPRGATLLDFPGFKNCIHGYWMKPKNGIAIAESVADALIRAGASPEAINASLRFFSNEVEEMREKGRELVRDAGIEGKSMVAAVPAVNYILDSFGIEVGAILVKEGAGFVSGSELTKIGEELESGKYAAIACPEAFRNAKAGEISRQLARDYGTNIVYLEMFSVEKSYVSIGYQNAARISRNRSSESSSGIATSVLLFTTSALGVAVLLEGALLIKSRVAGIEPGKGGGIFRKRDNTFSKGGKIR